MERIFCKASRLIGDKVTLGTTIFERGQDDVRLVEVQVSVSACESGVQPSFTFYVADPVELFELAENIKCAAVALVYAKKFEAKAA